MPLPVIDTREWFRPLCAEIIGLLRSLTAEDWNRPTIAGSWRVREVVAHLCDTALRRLSFQRDRSMPTEATSREMTEPELLALINELNASWVRVAERFSTAVLTDLYAHASAQLVEFIEGLDPFADAVFPVSWAGQARSQQWLDIGREFTEIWHHGSQVRDAVGAGPFPDPRWLQAVLQVSMHALPHAYGDVQAVKQTSVVVEVTGPASGIWTLRHGGQKWDIDEGGSPAPAATVTMPDEVAWRLLFNAWPEQMAQSRVVVEGDAGLARPLLSARAVIV